MQPTDHNPNLSATSTGGASPSIRSTPPLVQAVKAFRRDLPNLLHDRPRQWVAYHKDQQIGFARTDLELNRECRRRGIPEDEFLVLFIEPEFDLIVVDPGEVE